MLQGMVGAWLLTYCFHSKNQQPADDGTERSVLQAKAIGRHHEKKHREAYAKKAHAVPQDIHPSLLERHPHDEEYGGSKKRVCEQGRSVLAELGIVLGALSEHGAWVSQVFEVRV